MAKFKVSTKGNLITITQKQFGKFNVNERELKVFEENLLPGFFRPKLERKNKIVYTAPKSISLDSYIQQDFTLHKLYSVLAQFSEMVKSVRSTGFYLYNIVLEKRLIYVKEMTGELFFLYTPLITQGTGVNVFMFLSELVKSIQSKDITVIDECNKVKAFLDSPSRQEYIEIEGFIQENYPQIYKHVHKKNSGKSGLISSTKLGYEQQRHPSMRLEETSETRDTTLLEELGTTLLEEEKGTTLLQDDDISAILIRRKTGEIININKSIFRIGKLHGECDFIVSDNTAISKHHASIHKKGIIFFIEDNGSKNHTYINGAMVRELQMELHNSDVLKLANEEFEFYIN